MVRLLAVMRSPQLETSAALLDLVRKFTDAAPTQQG